jgi:hypothetical protein
MFAVVSRILKGTGMRHELDRIVALSLGTKVEVELFQAAG